MTSLEIRQKFTRFFEGKGHKQLPAAILVPQDDPSVLFNTAGMQQFKAYYADPSLAPHPRVVTVQPSFRTSDIEEVGDERHLTFFEMLGNFSFNDSVSSSGSQDGYFKEEAIAWAWEFITQILKIDPARIYVTVYRGEKNIPLDDESIRLWRKIGVADKNIRMGTHEDNFWGPVGAEGPCGPTTEVYVDGIEIWNLVFNEYYKTKDGKYQKMATRGVDTGMGLERVAMVLQGQPTIFETDLFASLAVLLEKTELSKKSRRILADHARAVAFLIAEGVIPSNKERGYVLRRLIRRAQTQDPYGKQVNFVELVRLAALTLAPVYPQLKEAAKQIEAIVTDEIARFAKTLANALKVLEKISRAPGFHGEIEGEDAFHLFDTYGLPLDTLRDITIKLGYVVDEGGFEVAFEKHRDVSKIGQAKKFGGHGLLLDTGELRATDEKEVKIVTRLHTATHLLQAALRKVLGEDVLQRGSDITAERLRFDFSYSRKLTPEELKQVEALVSGAVQAALPMQCKELPLEEAKKTGALYLSHARYPTKVKVYFAGKDLPSAFSKELCGGPHVANTKEVGVFRIVKEEALSQGARRIRAVVE